VATDQGRALRRLTVSAAVAAVGLNVALMVETEASRPGAGSVQDEVVSALAVVFPGIGLRAGPTPSPAPTARPHAVTGAS
jgi:hypothetical protein